jgi:hypothetical protein
MPYFIFTQKMSLTFSKIYKFLKSKHSYFQNWTAGTLFGTKSLVYLNMLHKLKILNKFQFLYFISMTSRITNLDLESQN